MSLDIQIIEKPDWVTWNEIQDVVHAAHQENIERGIVMLNALLPGEKIKEKVGDGKMFVALLDNKVVGTAAFKVKESTLWYGCHRYGYRFFEAVHPEYKGQGIYGALCKRQTETAVATGLDMMMFDTHERNQNVITMNERNGYYKVGCKVCADHDNVVMVKWLRGCPYSRFTMTYRYIENRAYTKLKNKLWRIVKGKR